MSADSALKRKSTMENTAEEGLQYLKDNKADKLISMQGLDRIEEPPVKLQKMTTLITEENKMQNEETDSLKKTKTGEATKASDDYMLKNKKNTSKLPENRSNDKTLSPDKMPKAKKMNTMEGTAKDGIEYLKGHKTNTWLRMQGLDSYVDSKDDSSSDCSEEAEVMKRTKTMEATLAEAEHILKDVKSGRRSSSDDVSESRTSVNEDCPKVKRINTMVDTAKSAQYFLGEDEYKDTRSKTKVSKEIESKSNEDPDSPGIAMKRTRTMADTTTEAEYYLGNEKYGNSRSATKLEKESQELPCNLKRMGTMANTTLMAQSILQNETILESRSQSKALNKLEKDA